MYVTICVEDCKNPDIKIEPEQIVFHGVAGLQQKVYEITIPLYAVIEPEVKQIKNTVTIWRDNLFFIFINL